MLDQRITYLICLTINQKIQTNMDDSISLENRMEQEPILSTLTNGKSMYPMLKNKSKVLICKTKEYSLYDVCLFKYYDHYVLHRLIKVDDDKYEFRGDNSIDIECVSKNDILGKLLGYYNGNNYIGIDKYLNRRYYILSVIRRPMLLIKRRILCIILKLKSRN